MANCQNGSTDQARGAERDGATIAAARIAEALREVAEGLESGRYRLDSFDEEHRAEPLLGDTARPGMPVETNGRHWLQVEYTEVAAAEEFRQKAWEIAGMMGGHGAPEQLSYDQIRRIGQVLTGERPLR